MNTETWGFFHRNSVITPFSTMGLCSRSYEMPVPWCANSGTALKTKPMIKIQNADDLAVTVPPLNKVIHFGGTFAGFGLENLAASIGTLGCTSFSWAVDCPLTQVVVHLNGMLT